MEQNTRGNLLNLWEENIFFFILEQSGLDNSAWVSQRTCDTLMY